MVRDTNAERFYVYTNGYYRTWLDTPDSRVYPGGIVLFNDQDGVLEGYESKD